MKLFIRRELADEKLNLIEKTLDFNKSSDFIKLNYLSYVKYNLEKLELQESFFKHLIFSFDKLKIAITLFLFYVLIISFNQFIFYTESEIILNSLIGISLITSVLVYKLYKIRENRKITVDKYINYSLDSLNNKTIPEDFVQYVKKELFYSKLFDKEIITINKQLGVN